MKIRLCHLKKLLSIRHSLRVQYTIIAYVGGSYASNRRPGVGRVYDEYMPGMLGESNAR